MRRLKQLSSVLFVACLSLLATPAAAVPAPTDGLAGSGGVSVAGRCWSMAVTPGKPARAGRCVTVGAASDAGSFAPETATVTAAKRRPAPKPTPVPTPSPSATPSPVPSTPTQGWTPTFSEEFSRDAALGSFLTSYTNFDAYPYPWTDTSRNVRSNPGYYHPQKTLSVSGGVMDAWLRYDSALGRYLVSAPMPKMTAQTYGRYAIRLRADRIDGYKIAPLLWPVSERWPDDGEINMPEGDLDGSPLAAFMHYARPQGGQDYFSTKVDHTAWHVYETLWTPGRVEFRVDGTVVGVSTQDVPSTPMRWVLQMETRISQNAPATTAQGHVQIDWVKAYSYTP